jgi:acyl-CoA thioesterase FadM
MEVERGRYLSLLLTGSEDYYAMMKEKGIAFISYASTFTYYQPLFPGQLYTIETYFPSNKVNKENLKLPFYQEMRNAEGNIIATSENSMVQISLQEQSSKRPYKTLIKNL